MEKMVPGRTAEEGSISGLHGHNFAVFQITCEVGDQSESLNRDERVRFLYVSLFKFVSFCFKF